MILTPESPSTVAMMDALDHMMKTIPDGGEPTDPRPLFMASVVYQRIVLSACRDAGMNEQQMLAVTDEAMMVADAILSALEAGPPTTPLTKPR